MGVPAENVPNLVSHVLLALLSTVSWILCATIFESSFPTHIEAWIVVQTIFSAVQTLYAVWASIVDFKDSTFYERNDKTFFTVAAALFVVNIAMAVTGAVYWRNGDRDRQLVFDSVVVLSWLTLAVLGLVAAQDRVKVNSS